MKTAILAATTAALMSAAPASSSAQTPMAGAASVVGESGERSNTCWGGEEGSPVAVYVHVDPKTGAVLNARAVWSLRTLDKDRLAPRMAMEYPIERDVVADRPAVALVRIAVRIDRGMPKAKSASLILAADGVEAVRRPWTLYAEQLDALEKAPAGKVPLAMEGVLPLASPDEAGTPDPQLEPLFAGIGAGRVKRLEVRVVGDEGSVLASGSFDLSGADMRRTGPIIADLHQAEWLGRRPEHCKIVAARDVGRPEH